MSQKCASTSKSKDGLLHTAVTSSNHGAASFAGILPFVRFLRYQLKLPMYLAGVTTKEKGYRAVSLILILICRPQLNCASINQLRGLMVQKFIQRVFTLSYGQQRGASVDILYDLFEKLRPELIEAAFNRHLNSLRHRGLLPKNLNAYFDSTLIEKSPNSSFENAAWLKMRDQSYYGFKLFLMIDVATKTLLYVRFAAITDSDVAELIPAVKAVHQLGFRLQRLGFDRGFWSGDNFKFLQWQKIKFFTVLKNYQQEHRDLIGAVNSRTPGRQLLKSGVWITEIEPISINTYFTTKTVRCIVVRQKNCNPWAIISNDFDLSKIEIVQFYHHRNLVEKVIEELKNEFAIQKLPRKNFQQNTCFVLLTLWSFNLMVDYKLTVLKNEATLFQQLTSLRKILFEFAAVVFYERCAIRLSFEITHPLQLNLINFNGL
jgi:hypothetical protein